MDAMLDRDAPLFEGTIPCRVSVGASDRDGRVSGLTVRVLSGCKTGTSRSHVLCVEVTDESDLCFYHSLTVDEVEFATLKTEQAILVDFNTFPSHLVALLRSCLESKHETHPKYMASLALRDSTAGSPSVFAILETNQFKQLTHLELSLRAGTDSSTKRYLASRLGHSLAVLHRLMASNDSDKAQLQAVLAANADLRGQLQLVRSECDAREASSRAEQAQLLLRAQEEAASQKQQLQASLRREMGEVAARGEASIAALRSQLEAMTAAYHKLQADHAHTETVLRETQDKQTTTHSNLLAADQDLARQRALAAELEATLQGRNRELAEATTRIAVLEQQVSDGRKMLEQAQALHASAESSRVAAEERMRVYKQAVDKHEAVVERYNQEISKGNGFIERLQEELKASKAKTKAKTELLQAANEKLAERERALVALERERDAAQLEADRERTGRERAEQAADSMRGALKEARETIENNQNVIAWLNKELNEAQAAPVTSFPLHVPTRPMPRPNPPVVPAASAAQARSVPLSRSLPSAVSASASAASLATPAAAVAPAAPADRSVSAAVAVEPSTAPSRKAPSSVNPYLASVVPLPLPSKAAESAYFPAGQQKTVSRRLDSSTGVPGGGPVPA